MEDNEFSKYTGGKKRENNNPKTQRNIHLSFELSSLVAHDNKETSIAQFVNK